MVEDHKHSQMFRAEQVLYMNDYFYLILKNEFTQNIRKNKCFLLSLSYVLFNKFILFSRFSNTFLNINDTKNIVFTKTHTQIKEKIND